MSNSLYSVISAMRAFMPFVTLAIFKWMKEKDIAMMRLMFFIATGMFALMIFAPNRWLSIAFFAVALMAMSCVSALLWSIYIPGLGKTGKVSSVNGVLDCSGYVAAAVANLLFASVMKNASWNMVYILWAAMGIIGIVATFFVSSKKKSEN